MKNAIYFIAVTALLISCKVKNPSAKEDDNSNRIVMISTEYGNMKIRLYDETPLHRDNFVKLANKKFFDGTLFHRVIDGFMIQGGDPDSRNAAPGVRLGEGGPGYQLPAEFRKALFHKKGVIASAREGDKVNPEKKSAGSQFYIAQGKVFQTEDFDSLEVKINERRRKAIFNRIREKNQEKLDEWQKEGETVKISELIRNIQNTVDSLADKEKLVLSEAQKKAYASIGGIPHLDGNYTVFGEVIEGIEVIDKVAKMATDEYDRPLNDVKMTVTVLQ